MTTSHSQHILTPTQQGIYYDQLRMPGNPCYNEGVVGEIKISVCPEIFAETLNRFVGLFDILTADFTMNGDGQLVHEFGHFSVFPFELVDLSTDPEANKKANIMIQERFATPFELGKERLIDARLYKLKQQHFLFEVRFHHLVCDAFGLSLMMEEFDNVYRSVLEQRSDIEIGAFSPFLNEINSEADYLDSKVYIKDRSFWMERFSQLPERMLNKKKTHDPYLKSHRLTLELPENVRLDLDALCTRVNMSYQQLGICVLSIYFAKILQRENLVFGVPVHRRRTRPQRRTFGTFTSDLPLLLDISACESIHDVLLLITSELRKNYRHQRYPKSHLARDLNLVNKGVDQLPEVFFNFQPFSSTPLLDGFINFSYLSSGFEQDPLHIRLCHYGDEQPLKVNFDFREEYLSVAEGEIFADRFISILREVAIAGEDHEWRNIDIHSTEDKSWIAKTTTPALPYKPNQTVIDLVEKQSEKTPDKVAVTDGDLEYTYGQLITASNAIAKFLVASGVTSEQKIIISLDQKPQLLVALLGVLRAGGCYIPVDSTLPSERIEFMIQDSGANYCLGDNSKLEACCAKHNVNYIDIETHADIQSSDKTPLPTVTGHQLAYIIYTSGTTGQPKGVMVEHSQLACFMTAMQNRPGISANDIVLAHTAISFDIHLLELFLALTVGASVAFASKQIQQNPKDLLAAIKRMKVSFIQATPSAWRTLLDSGFEPSSEIKMLAGGEALSNELGARLTRSGELWNMYGPTETTIWSTCGQIDDISHIGLPINNTDIKVLNSLREEVVVGAVGELYIGGTGVARGYWCRDELTEEKFVVLGSESETSARYFATGDLVSRVVSEQGEVFLQFHGRKDNQVKLRGHRIELAEIEYQLAQNHDVNEACVVAHKMANDEVVLVAYVVAEQHVVKHKQLVEQLISRAGKTMPAVMVPQHIQFIANMPLSHNGKRDISQLPDPDFISNEYQPPITKTEKILTDMWSDLLAVESQQISVNQSFFSLGGNSVLLVRLNSMIGDKFQIEVAIHHLFEMRTVIAQAEEIDRLLLQKSLLAMPSESVTEVAF